MSELLRDVLKRRLADFRRCHARDGNGRCADKVRFVVGTGPMNWAYVCAKHVASVKRPDDEVMELS